jgi:hypothetical protein
LYAAACRKARLLLLLLIVLLLCLVLLFHTAAVICSPLFLISQDLADRTLMGLYIAIDHPAFSSSPQIMCAAAPVCKAWREAVQQCSVCNMTVIYNPLLLLQQPHSFVQWLPKHAALVKHIAGITEVCENQDTDEEPWVSEAAGAQQLLQEALQAAADMPELGTAAAAAGLATAEEAPVAVPQWQQLGWRLSGFSSDLPAAPTLLSVLPAHSLTRLELGLQFGTAATAASVGLTQLARLTRLRLLFLEVYNHDHAYNVPDGCFEGLEQLRSLTSLRVSGVWDGMQQQLETLLALPLPLQLLQLRVFDVTAAQQSQCWLPRIAHLTQLTELITRHNMPPGAALPPSLQRLDVQQCPDLEPVLPLRQLQHLTMVADRRNRDGTPAGALEQAQVLQLAQLPALQMLALHYRNVEAAAAAAQTWPLLPQLRELRVQGYINTQHVAKILSGAAAATGLTSLQLTFWREDATPADKPAACANLAGLTGLRQLQLTNLCLAPGDVMFLTALTGLTHLDLNHVNLQQKSDDTGGGVVVTALAQSVTQLRHLAMDYCGIDLSSTHVLAVTGQLRQLTVLKLDGNSGLTEQGLMQLTGLTRLQDLSVDFDAPVTGEMCARFGQQLRLGTSGKISNQL